MRNRQNSCRLTWLIAVVIGLVASFNSSAQKLRPPNNPPPARKHSAAASKIKTPPPVYESIGNIERLDPSLDALIPSGAKIEKLAEGFTWAEGPVWIRQGDYLLFSDVPKNVVHKWQEGSATSIFLKNSGYSAGQGREGEPGSNGLTTDSQGRLVLCQHGNRQIARLERDGKLSPVARYYEWRRFNSPNDLVYKSNGDLCFTDPPYGLVKGNDDPAKELNFSGVFRVNSKGDVTLLTDELTFPNGIAFSPDEKTLYVNVSDPKRAVIMSYPVLPDGKLGRGHVLFDATTLVGDKNPGLPDGLKVDKKGNLFTTGPGGVLVLSPEGKHLGTIRTGVPTANCAWGGNGSVLYITANHWLCRIQTSTIGEGF